MNAYLRFCLKRRWLAKSSCIIFGISFLVSIALLTVDKWLPQQDIITIKWPQHLFEHLESTETIRFVEDDAMINITFIEPSHYIIHTHSTNLPNQTISAMIMFAHQRFILDSFSEDDQNKVVLMLEPTIEHQSPSSSILSIALISFLYFTLLGFSSTMSSDILSEKHSQALLMILSSYSKNEYFNMKLIQSGLNILIQCFLGLSGVVSSYYIRNHIDQGKGFFLYIYEHGWISIKLESFQQGFELLTSQGQWSYSIILGGLSFIIGLVSCMLILLWLSLKAQKSEDIAMIQTPFYLLVVLMFYASLWIGELQGLNQALSPWLIQIPILSMIFHPLQLSMNNQPLHLSILSISFAMGCLIMLFKASKKSFNSQIL
jgi:hypothetical protein